MSNYVDAPATRMLATFCCCCGLPLVDSISVELGIGPDCRSGETGGIDEATRQQCNRLTHEAAVAAQEGNIELVRQVASEVAALGLASLATKIGSRFVNAEKNVKIEITLTAQGDAMQVKTPFKRSMGQDFVAAWRAIPGRRYTLVRGTGMNIIPLTSKKELLALFERFFPGQYGKGPKGLFRIKKAPTDATQVVEAQVV